jgi:hypothetical protein
VPEPTPFQVRRRRAAKLTAFFGVNHRDLFGEVLESIEKGMREDVRAGGLEVGEMEVCTLYLSFFVSFFCILVSGFQLVSFNCLLSLRGQNYLMLISPPF